MHPRFTLARKVLNRIRGLLTMLQPGSGMFDLAVFLSDPYAVIHPPTAFFQRSWVFRHVARYAYFLRTMAFSSNLRVLPPGFVSDGLSLLGRSTSL